MEGEGQGRSSTLPFHSSEWLDLPRCIIGLFDLRHPEREAFSEERERKS